MSIMGGLVAEKYDRTYTDRVLVRRIIGYFRVHIRTITIVALMVVLAAVVATITPLLIARAIDTLSTEPSLQLILGMAGFVTLLGVLGWIFNYVRQRLTARAVGDQNASGRIISRVTSDTQDFATVVTLTIELLSQIGLVCVVTVLMFAVNWRLALITIASGPLVIGVAIGFRVLARRVMRQSQRANAEVNTVVSETISGIAVAKNFRQEAALFTDFQATNALTYRVQLQRIAVFGSIFPLLNTLSGIATASIIYAGGLFVSDGTVSTGDWYLFVQTLFLFFYPITSLASFWSQFQQGLAASERVFSLIDSEPQVVQIANNTPGNLRGEVEWRKAWFRYVAEQEPGASNQAPEIADSQIADSQIADFSPPAPPTPTSWVVADFSLHIPAGQALAVVGHTGAGKSSLVKMLLRFYEFQQGELLVDGQDIRSFDIAAYRRQIGYVPQMPFLFSGSVADNIRYGRPEASDAEVLAVARQFGDGSWIDDLPQGIATDVGERGARLSLGQRQLVALARVLLQNPAILLLDEATASIDPITEGQVQAALAQTLKGRTSIVIAHRLSTVEAADRIIVLQRGVIVESGTHDQLLVHGGHYAELYATYFRHQAIDYKPWESVEASQHVSM
jgi:ATP-binding cassette, subfamily B, bacterial